MSDSSTYLQRSRVLLGHRIREDENGYQNLQDLSKALDQRVDKILYSSHTEEMLEFFRLDPKNSGIEPIHKVTSGPQETLGNWVHPLIASFILTNGDLEFSYQYHSYVFRRSIELELENAQLSNPKFLPSGAPNTPKAIEARLQARHDMHNALFHATRWIDFDRGPTYSSQKNIVGVVGVRTLQDFVPLAPILTQRTLSAEKYDWDRAVALFRGDPLHANATCYEPVPLCFHVEPTHHLPAPTEDFCKWHANYHRHNTHKEPIWTSRHIAKQIPKLFRRLIKLTIPNLDEQGRLI